MNDNDILDRVTASVSGLHMETPVDAIVARGHVRRRRRMSGAAAVAVVVAAGLGLSAATVHRGPHNPVANNGDVQLASFTLVSNTNGTDTLTLVKGVPLDANALRQKLADAGIPAVVNVGSTCDSHPQPDGLDSVISPQRLSDGSVELVITPSAMPSGAELSIGVFPDGKTWGLATIGAPMTCSNTDPIHQSTGGATTRSAVGTAS
ncbi:MAG TPA: hypothetical protein VK662_07695 [Acidothermaceae bacterium]|jgi:hypothetical protein|nr:hypothetical protein [Acidothermaceae bacterium]